jgi:hypothetical protein
MDLIVEARTVNWDFNDWCDAGGYDASDPDARRMFECLLAYARREGRAGLNWSRSRPARFTSSNDPIDRPAIRPVRRDQYEPLRAITMVKLVGYITQSSGQNVSFCLVQNAAQPGEPPEERTNLDHLLPHI